MCTFRSAKRRKEPPPLGRHRVGGWLGGWGGETGAGVEVPTHHCPLLDSSLDLPAR